MPKIVKKEQLQYDLTVAEKGIIITLESGIFNGAERMFKNSYLHENFILL